MGKGNPIKKILKAPKKLIGEITGKNDLLKAQKKQDLHSKIVILIPIRDYNKIF